MAPMRRKSHGSIRSPHVKRDSQSQVVIEGWLYKLEGGALKQFKHRWCVLADFCLFFYKGPSEDKITSSILLPSYKISPCTSDDKISRKFAFKAEHQNMKTYYFAAEDQDSMKRWMNAISLASIMQKFVRSENYDTTFSSASNDDEDSGFTSYRSRRYTSQKLNPTNDSHFSSEPLKQRSNSYGDRMGEVYLGSDDKYPDVYKNSHVYKTVSLQDEAPRRQPLYANAPPKPKRLTHSDNYAAYPSDYFEAQDHENSTGGTSIYHLRSQKDHMHSDYHQAMGYVPGNQNKLYYTGNDLTGMETNEMQYIDNYPENMHTENSSHLSRNQPPRPRSADFLERDGEIANIPDVAHYAVNAQPQRPKSSLEYYNHYVDSEDCSFDDYREAVRIQADNLYLNKSLHKHPKHSKSRGENEERLNIHYVRNTGYLTNESISPCYASTSKNSLNDRYQTTSINANTSHNESFNSEDKYSRPKNSQESMQRLMEWKQRMLQSPLTKRNNSHSSNTYSPLTLSPLKTYKSDHQKKLIQNIDSHDTHVHNSSNYGNYTDQNSSYLLQRRDDYQQNEPYESQPAGMVNNHSGTRENFKTDSDHFGHIVNNTSESSSKLNKENVLYCVDSENNEILFSYNDNSPSDDISSNLQTCHYPPQMHSFSTLPNVSSIGNENHENNIYDDQIPMAQHSSKSKYSHAKYNQNFQDSNSIAATKLKTTYSSDDEDNIEEEFKNPQEKKENIQNESQCFIEDSIQLDRYQTSSPDYVNIGAFCGEAQSNFVNETNTVSDSFEISQAVMKPLEQASKAASFRQCGSQPLSVNNSISEELSQFKESSYCEQWGDENTHNQTLTSISSKDNYDSDLECDIKREDYYRASQIFYASTRAKIKQISSKQPELSKSRRSSQNSPLRSSGYVNVSMVSEEYGKNLSNLDKDIGIPLQHNSSEISSPRKKPDIVESNEHFNRDYTLKEANSYANSLQISAPCKLPDECKSFSNDTVLNKEHEIDFLTTNDQRKNSTSSEGKKKLSYEELRGQLLRKREAPPPNIVQERIKKFEVVENGTKGIEKENSTELTPQSFPSDAHKEKISSRAIGKRNRHKANRQKAARRILHSDSEAINLDISDDSSDDLTMKSAPILLSPFSSVLADLRKTAEAGKESIKSFNEKPINRAMKEYFHSLNDSNNQKQSHSENVNEIPTNYIPNSFKSTSLPNYKSYDILKPSMECIDDAEYLPMDGLKSSNNANMYNEPEYVSMNGYKFCPQSVKENVQKSANEEEHVYNEPFSPPPSFLHDVYEKQKSKQMQYQIKSSSSEDSLTENIYEKPFHRFPSGSIRSLRNEYSYKSVQETNSVLMSSLSCSNVTTIGRCNESNKTNNTSTLAGNASSRPNVHHYEQPTLSVSVPDLLQLQQIKDSDASDADDEASRDFDSVAGARLPAYQSSILNQFSNSEIRNFSTKQLDCNSSFDSEIVSANLEDLPNSSSGSYSHHYELPSLKPLCQTKLMANEVKPVASYQALYSGSTNIATTSVSESSNYSLKNDQTDDERKYQMQKLRVYTKGKKPEAPKIFPVPFNLEESEICKILERKDSLKNQSTSNVSLVIPDTDSVKSSTTVSNDLLSENVAYFSQSDVKSPNLVNIVQPIPPSYRPDVVPEIQTEEKVPNDKISPSKSPNSAPYYYSDLYFANGIGYHPSHFPLLKRSDLAYMDKTSPPRSNSSILNNALSTSPASCKGDIGRKVNKINRPSSSSNCKDPVNEKALIKYWKGDGAKSNLRCSLDIFQSSKSKYLDAEKNKYEAGHTLEKTRSNNAMSYLKHRASTPELNACYYQSDEPVYENLVFQPKLRLQKRLSHSLEGLPNTPEIDSDDIKKVDTLHEPVYENIEFYNLKKHSATPAITPLVLSKHSQQDDRATHIRQVTSQDTYSFPERQFCNPVSKVSEIDDMTNLQSSSSKIEKDNIENDFLDQNILRRVSEQHFFSKGTKPQTLTHIEKLPIIDGSMLLQYNPSDKIARNESVELKNEQSCDPGLMCEGAVIENHGTYWEKDHDSDSTSGAASSCDEASVDSDNRHFVTSGKIKTADISRSLSSEIYKKEPVHLRKLVQQSEGLMCKGKRLSVSAGDLLGKTHEELVLLLIQLRRNQTKILRAKEKLEKQNIQESSDHQPVYHNYKELQKQIQLLEKQYEVTQPLITLVDNMVKLGSLYGSSNRRSFSLPLLDTSQEEISPPIQTNNSSHIGESSILSKLLAEESNLQKRINEIYSLDKGLRNETNSISSLHQDKEMLECTLSGMRNKILDHQDRPSELQKLKKQQKMIEKELFRVKRLLSTSAKKIEDAASKNDQMEKDILHLRQILTEALKTGSSETKSQRNRADIEAELCRVQNVLDELANHRQEINNTVEKLKSESHPNISNSVDMRESPVVVNDDKEDSVVRKFRKGVEVRASPTGVAGSAPLPVRKKQHSTYLETDLDTMHIRDLAMIHEKDLDDIPVYANAEEINNTTDDCNKGYDTEDSNFYENCALETNPDQCSMQDINDADERMKRFYGIIPKDKPSEIKTVRIVKRQSERRNRERDKKRVTYDDQSSVWVLEEPDISSDDHLDADEGKITMSTASRPTSINLLTSSTNRHTNTQSAHERLFGAAAKNEREKSTSTKTKNRVSPIKRSKRRHYTVSGYQYMLDPQFSQYFRDRPRSRDDVDMERCLRTANTPDIVRSTIKKNDVFDDKMIERELMLPPKIEIPERYVEVEPDQLSAMEKLRRSQKAENICKMLSETTTTYEDVEERSKSPEALHKKLNEEKRKRAHLLNLNRAIAREVVEKSKAVAANICTSGNQISS